MNSLKVLASALLPSFVLPPKSNPSVVPYFQRPQFIYGPCFLLYFQPLSASSFPLHLNILKLFWFVKKTHMPNSIPLCPQLSFPFYSLLHGENSWVVFTFFSWICSNQDTNDLSFHPTQRMHFSCLTLLFSSIWYSGSFLPLETLSCLWWHCILQNFPPWLWLLPHLVCKVLRLLCHPWSVGDSQVLSSQAAKLPLKLCTLTLGKLISLLFSATVPMLKTTKPPQPMTPELMFHFPTKPHCFSLIIFT